MLNIDTKKFIDKYRSLGLEVKTGIFSSNGITSRYGIINDKSTLPNLVFVHGAPGYLDEFRNYYRKTIIHHSFRILALERPGFGSSQPGKPITNIAAQASHLGNLLQKTCLQPCYLLGHSYGGPISCKIAADFPKIIRGLLLLAPALDPELELNFWTAHLVKTKLKPLIPLPLQTASNEKLVHASALKEITPFYRKISQPIWYFHGKQDLIVPFANSDYAKREFVNADLTMTSLPFRNHFINLFPPRQILELLCQLATKST